MTWWTGFAEGMGAGILLCIVCVYLMWRALGNPENA